MQVEERRGGGVQGKKMHVTVPIALWGYASAVLSGGSPPPLYGLKSLQTMTHAGHVIHL